MTDGSGVVLNELYVYPIALLMCLTVLAWSLWCIPGIFTRKDMHPVGKASLLLLFVVTNVFTVGATWMLFIARDMQSAVITATFGIVPCMMTYLLMKYDFSQGKERLEKEFSPYMYLPRMITCGLLGVAVVQFTYPDIQEMMRTLLIVLVVYVALFCFCVVLTAVMLIAQLFHTKTY